MIEDTSFITEPEPLSPSNHAFDIVEADLHEPIQQFIKRFEQWHDVTEPSDL